MGIRKEARKMQKDNPRLTVELTTDGLVNIYDTLVDIIKRLEKLEAEEDELHNRNTKA